MCPWKLGQGHRNINNSSYYPNDMPKQPPIGSYHAFTQESGRGEWYANTKAVADRNCTKNVSHLLLSEGRSKQ